MMMSSKAAALLVAVVLSWGLSSHAGAAEQQFCARAEASRSCAKPPTVDDLFKVEDYLGKWYEIGSTASFKLLTEAGLACNQARYSASPAGNLSLLNSGLRVISPLAVAEVAAVNVAARGACAAAREVCHQLAAVSQLSRSLANLSLARDGAAHAHSQLLQLSQQLTSSVQAAQQALNDLSEDVSLIQQANGQISQANSSSLQSSVAEMKQYAREGGGGVASLASTLNKIRTQVKEASHKSGWSAKSKDALQQAALSLASITLKVGASSSAIELSLKAVGVSANSLAGNGHPLDGGAASVSSVTGSITQPNATSAAKLEVSIIGNKAPYWIIALALDQGAYSAALVYSCSEVAGVTAKSLFVLSREPQLQSTTLDAFLAKAESLGIYNDCEDPFLLTLQKGGDCGQPPSSS